MFPSVQALTGSLNHFSRSMSSALRGFSDLYPGQEAPLRGIEEASDSTGAGSGRPADQSQVSPSKTPPPAQDPATAAAELLTSRAQVRAAIALVRAEDETVGTLLDTVG